MVCSNTCCNNNNSSNNNSSSNNSNSSKLNNNSSLLNSSNNNSSHSSSQAASDCHQPMLEILCAQRCKKLLHLTAQAQLGKLHQGLLLGAPSHLSSLVSSVQMMRRCVPA